MLQPIGNRLRKLGFAALLFLASLFATPAGAQTAYILTSDGKLVSAPLARPDAVSEGITLTGVATGESLVGIDLRPQTGQLYALGVNPANDTATLYIVSLQTGYLGMVSPVAGSIAFTIDGTTPIDLPDPSLVKWDIDFNPAADRLRVVAGSLNFRVNPNTGAAVDGDNTGATSGSVTGINPDGPIGGGTTTIAGAAYTNNQPNNGNLTTLYTLDPASNGLYIQDANTGTQTLVQTVTLGGSTLDFSGTGLSFDLMPGVNTASLGSPVASGEGIALLNVGGTTSFYRINLVNGQATSLGGNLPTAVSMALRLDLPTGISMSKTGTTLFRFALNNPTAATTQALDLGSVMAGETLAGIAGRPQTGQIFALGVDATADTASLYLVDPQSGVLTLIGTPSLIAFVTSDGTTPVDLPDPATAAYGMDFDPTTDRLRVVTSTHLNFEVTPTGSPVDGDFAGTPVPGINPDQGTTGTNLLSAAFTNSYPQAPGGPVNLFTIGKTANDALYTQNPPDSGHQFFRGTLAVGGLYQWASMDFPASVFTWGDSFVTDYYFIATTPSGTGLRGRRYLAGLIGDGSVPLSGLVVDVAPTLRVEHPVNTQIYDHVDPVDFGSQRTFTSGTREIVLRNPSGEDIFFTTSLAANSPYSIVGQSSGAVISGSHVTLVVKFTPGSSGTITDTLRITSNDPSQLILRVALTGEGIRTLGDDYATVAASDTRLYPLVNDDLSPAATITAVDDPAIIIDGRALIIPAGYSGTFTYTIVDGGVPGQGVVQVTPAIPLANPSTYTGLLTAAGGEVVGTARLTLSAKGVATIALVGGTTKLNAKVTLPSGGTTGSVYTSLGYLTLTKNSNNTVTLSLAALGGPISGVLPALKPTGSAGKFHLALESLDPAFPGGAFAIATVSKTGLVSMTGLLPDGTAFSGSSALLENNVIPFYSIVSAAKPPGIVAGELTQTYFGSGISGELAWAKLPQAPMVKGVHLGGTAGTVTLTVNGGIFAILPSLYPGTGSLRLRGGNLAPETNAVTVTAAGVPTVPTGSLKSWSSGVVKVRNAYLRNGLFTATVLVPAVSPTKPVKARGIYIQSTNRAVGYFPGSTEGGKIELILP